MYRILTTVNKLEKKRRAIKSIVDKTDPDNPKITWEYEDIGWFVNFQNSHESLFVGTEKPDDLEPGTEVEILIVSKRKT